MRNAGVLVWFDSQRVARDNGLEVTGVVAFNRLDLGAAMANKGGCKHWSTRAVYQGEGSRDSTSNAHLAESCMSAGPNL